MPVSDEAGPAGYRPADVPFSGMIGRGSSRYCRLITATRVTGQRDVVRRDTHGNCGGGLWAMVGGESVRSLIWWLGVGSCPLSAGRWTIARTIDHALGLPAQPTEATVKAALLTGCRPDVAANHTHPAHRPDDRLAAWIQQRSALRAWVERGVAVRYGTGEPPISFQQRPRAEMAACPGPVPTVGSIRRGEAVARDLTGDWLVARGHRDLAPLSAAQVAGRIAGWAARFSIIFLVTDHLAVGTVVQQVMEGLMERKFDVIWVGVPVVWPDDRLCLAMTPGLGGQVQSAFDVTPVIDLWLGGQT